MHEWLGTFVRMHATVSETDKNDEFNEYSHLVLSMFLCCTCKYIIRSFTVQVTQFNVVSSL